MCPRCPKSRPGYVCEFCGAGPSLAEMTRLVAGVVSQAPPRSRRVHEYERVHLTTKRASVMMRVVTSGLRVVLAPIGPGVAPRVSLGEDVSLTRRGVARDMVVTNVTTFRITLRTRRVGK